MPFDGAAVAADVGHHQVAFEILGIGRVEFIHRPGTGLDGADDELPQRWRREFDEAKQRQASRVFHDSPCSTRPHVGHSVIWAARKAVPRWRVS